MLLHDDVVTDGKAKPGAFSGRFGSEERGEQLLLHLRRNTRAVVADTDLHPVAEIFGRRGQGRLVVAAITFSFSLGRRIEPVRDQVQQNPRDVLRKHVDFAGARIEGALSNNRTFSIAIAAWSAKVVTNSICLSVNGRTSERVKIRTPIATFSRRIGTQRIVR